MNELFWGSTAALLVAFWGGYLGVRALFRPLSQAFVRAGFVRPNFRGEAIPVGMGTALWLALLLTGVILLLLSDWVQVPWLMLHDLIGCLVVGTLLFAVGLLDDAVGNRDATGLFGHLRTLVRDGVLTTGLMKAGVGIIAGLLGAWLLGVPTWKMPVAAMLIALSANSVNLLDLRPGRACKGGLIALAMLTVTSLRAETSPVFWLVLGLTLAYLPYDLQARSMMGDAGANLLGGALGVLVVETCSDATAVGWLAFLVLFHLYAEKYSLSEAIEKNRWLRWLDILGRT
jgi:UDP-GlcNAc:undecaprenyl-phosphate GlcNAc-1-phosphate transferase